LVFRIENHMFLVPLVIFLHENWFFHLGIRNRLFSS